MICKLIRNNHLNVLDYRMNFFQTALSELHDFTDEDIKLKSLSHRLSRLENDEYAKMMKVEDKKVKKEKLVIDHEAQMRKAQGL